VFLRADISLGLSIPLLCASADPAIAQQLCGRKFSSNTQILRDVTRDPDAKLLSEDSRIVVLSDERATTLWTFTTKAHPAYPAVIRRRPREVGGQVVIELESRGPGPRAACDALVAEFRKQNEQMKNSLQP
jgi:hypothetical protein